MKRYLKKKKTLYRKFADWTCIAKLPNSPKKQSVHGEKSGISKHYSNIQFSEAYKAQS